MYYGSGPVKNMWQLPSEVRSPDAIMKRPTVLYYFKTDSCNERPHNNRNLGNFENCTSLYEPVVGFIFERRLSKIKDENENPC